MQSGAEVPVHCRECRWEGLFDDLESMRCPECKSLDGPAVGQSKEGKDFRIMALASAWSCANEPLPIWMFLLALDLGLVKAGDAPESKRG